MPDGVIDQIKQKLDVLEVLGDYIKLTKAGRNYKARCPFHAERTPSFMASPERQSWHCFGCGVGGDIFSFVMKIEGVEFGDALRLLARKAGVVLKRQDPQVQSQKKRLYEVCELATKFFETQLIKTVVGKKAYQYLIERGLKPETIKEWRLGWAHDKWRALYEFLKSRGYKDEEMLQAGLIVEKATDYGLRTTAGKNNAVVVGRTTVNNYYDRFRSRIIFPIVDIQGQVIAFGGRIFGEQAKKDDIAKYLNSPQTLLYDKSNILYGLNKAKNEIRQKDQCVIVEGYMDLIMSQQAGATNAVASSGTALTENHLNIISRYTKNLVTAFDSDEAGGLATRRSIDLALQRNFNVKVILMAAKDPADIVKKNPTEWLNLIDEARSVLDFYFTYAFAKHDANSQEGKRAIRKILLTVIKSLASKTEQSEWIKELARRLRIDERDLLSDMQKIKLDTSDNYGSQDISMPTPIMVKSRLEALEERFLGLCLICPQHFSEIAISEEDFHNEDLAQIFKEFKKIAGKKTGGDILVKLGKILKPELKTIADNLVFQIEQHERSDQDNIQEIVACVSELKLLRLRNELAALSFDIRDAQQEKNTLKLEKLLKKFSQISLELNRITN